MSDIRYASDTEMLYAQSRTVFVPGAPFRLDQSYCRAHLPLIAPQHPDMLADGQGYRMGVHATSHSLVLPIEAEALAASAAYRALEATLRAAPFAGKIAWDLLSKRASRLHATIVGGLELVDGTLPTEICKRLAGLAPVEFELRGLFSGNRNLGRFYLAIYPEMREGEQAFAAIQRALGRAPNAMFLMGQFNLIDHLTPEEAASLAQLLDMFRDTVFLRGKARELRVLASKDDLVLDATFTERVSLS